MVRCELKGAWRASVLRCWGAARGSYVNEQVSVIRHLRHSRHAADMECEWWDSLALVLCYILSHRKLVQEFPDSESGGAIEDVVVSQGMHCFSTLYSQ
jgi:hypothetical protein